MELGWTNWLQYGIKLAVDNGAAEETVLLVLLFPLITAEVAAFRHLVGLNGFGLFVPSILAVALVEAGAGGGLVWLVGIIGVASLARVVTRRLKLQYLPRMSLMLWLVSLGVIGGLVGMGQGMTIWPILIFVMVAENFIEVQMSKSAREAVVTTVETVIMAAGAAGVASWSVMRMVATSYPEIYMMAVAGFNIFVGKYTGLRLLEWWKFKELWRG